MVREGGLKLLTRHEVGSFIIMTTAMWLWFSHSGSAGTDCRDERASREEGLQSGRQANKTSSLPLLGFFLFAALLLPLSFGPSSLGVGTLSFFRKRKFDLLALASSRPGRHPPFPL